VDQELLDKVIKAYDIRGLVDEEISADFTFALGIAFAKFIEREREPATIVVGEDMREKICAHHLLIWLPHFQMA